MPLKTKCCCVSSVVKLCPILCDSKDSSMPGSCPPLSQRVCSHSCLLSQWCYLTISSSAAPFSFWLQSFLASESFLMSQLFCIMWPKYWSFSFSKSPSNENSGLIPFRIDLFDPCCPRDSQESSAPQFKSIYSLALSLLYGPTLTFIHDYWKNHSFWLTRTFVGKVMSLLFNMQMSRFIIAFLPRSKYSLISWLQSPSTVIL